MRKIIIYKDKITTMEWHEQERTWVEHDIAKLEGSIIKYLNRLVEIKPDVTVYDFMKHLEAYEATIDYFFQDFTRGVSLRPFLEEMEKDGEDAGLGNIELIWEGETKKPLLLSQASIRNSTHRAYSNARPLDNILLFKWIRQISESNIGLVATAIMRVLPSIAFKSRLE